MSHSHEFEPYVPVIPKAINQFQSIKPHPDEEKITDDDSYGDEDMKFEDQDPFADLNKDVTTDEVLKESPISDDFS